MKLLFARHGDPDYSIDNLTPKGKIEAELLSDRISKLDVRDFYVSPLGRAKATAEYTLKKMNRTAVELPWLREFAYKVDDPDNKGKLKNVPWDFNASYWTELPEMYDKDKWMEAGVMNTAELKREAKVVTDSLDELLAGYGYNRYKGFYFTEHGNSDLIVFFCHFGLEMVLLGHLIGCSAPVLWHGLFSAPSGVTMVETQERRKGEVSFRATMVGDISHLYIADESMSYSGFFREQYEKTDERYR